MSDAQNNRWGEGSAEYHKWDPGHDANNGYLQWLPQGAAFFDKPEEDKEATSETPSDEDGDNNNSNVKGKRPTDLSRRYFDMEGNELGYLKVERIRCAWARVDKDKFLKYCQDNNIDSDNPESLEELGDVQRKSFVINFEKYLLKEKSEIYFVKKISLRVYAKDGEEVRMLVRTLKVDKNSSQYNASEDNLKTFATGKATVSITFQDDYNMEEQFSFVDGPTGNGATPNGTYMARRHPSLGVNGNPKFGEPAVQDPITGKYSKDKTPTQPSFLLHPQNISKTEPKLSKDPRYGIAYAERDLMLIHATITQSEPERKKDNFDKDYYDYGGHTEGCIGVHPLSSMRRYLPFFATYVDMFSEFKVEVDFVGNLNINRKIYANHINTK